MKSTACIVLAAGEGTRMKSTLPKVMHQLAGRSMLAHVLSAAVRLEPKQICAVIGPHMESVACEVVDMWPDASIAVQSRRLGTGDAVKRALPTLEGFDGSVLVLFGDTPLVTLETLSKLRQAIESGASVGVLGFRAVNPTGYGRLLTNDGGALVAIREEADADEEEKRIDLCNSGVMAFDGQKLAGFIAALGNDNAKGEFYLTNAVAIAHNDGLEMVVVECAENEVLGINSRAQLALAEAAVQERLRAGAMEGGATLVAPDTVFLSHDTKLGRDVLVEPHVVFGLGVQVDDMARIRAFSHIEGAHVKSRAEIGPYARLRPGSIIGETAKIGNFVEIKNSDFGAGAKANHLSYIGDSSVGTNANIGAGTITCNYDGARKSRTLIGANAFIGSNSSLVAPVEIGEGAYIGSSSVITHDVSAKALALTRAEQKEITGWASKRSALSKTDKNLK
jgi:bifunctional UDP-N-acetylglucosamine pyrophosphorylase/glucosamine-1-phosphate N-acetyltransferase